MLPALMTPKSLLLSALALRAAVAVSLDDFTPRASNLPSACQTVYTSQINGCSGSDFTGGSCSSGCLSALQNLEQPVSRACQGYGSGNILGAFINAVGPATLCKNAPQPSSSSAQSTTTPTPTSTSSSAPTSTIDSTSSETSSSSTPTPTSSSDTSSAATTSDITTSNTDQTSVIISTATVVPDQSASIGTSVMYASSTGSDVSSPSDSSSASSSSSSTRISYNPQETAGGSGSLFDSSSGQKSAASGVSLSVSMVLVAITVGSLLVFGLL